MALAHTYDPDVSESKTSAFVVGESFASLTTTEAVAGFFHDLLAAPVGEVSQEETIQQFFNAYDRVEAGLFPEALQNKINHYIEERLDNGHPVQSVKAQSYVCRELGAEVMKLAAEFNELRLVALLKSVNPDTWVSLLPLASSPEFARALPLLLRLDYGTGPTAPGPVQKVSFKANVKGLGQREKKYLAECAEILKETDTHDPKAVLGRLAQYRCHDLLNPHDPFTDASVYRTGRSMPWDGHAGVDFLDTLRRNAASAQKQGQDASMRMEAIAQLGRLRDLATVEKDRVFRCLTEIVSAGYGVWENEAAESLRQLGKEGVGLAQLQATIMVLERAKDRRCGGSIKVAHAYAALTEEKDEAAKASAARAIIPALAAGGSEAKRAAEALGTLGEMGETVRSEAIRALKRCIQACSFREVQFAAAQALGRLGLKGEALLSWAERYLEPRHLLEAFYSTPVTCAIRVSSGEPSRVSCLGLVRYIISLLEDASIPQKQKDLLCLLHSKIIHHGVSAAALGKIEDKELIIRFAKEMNAALEMNEEALATIACSYPEASVPRALKMVALPTWTKVDVWAVQMQVLASKIQGGMIAPEDATALRALLVKISAEDQDALKGSGALNALKVAAQALVRQIVALPIDSPLRQVIMQSEAQLQHFLNIHQDTLHWPWQNTRTWGEVSGLLIGSRAAAAVPSAFQASDDPGVALI